MKQNSIQISVSSSPIQNQLECLRAIAVDQRLRSQQVRVSTMDLRIAAIAISGNLVLLTRNVSDFCKVPGLVTED
ncbi:type II toxin-antitoxin system VapC family toxin [Nostoc sp. LPT]|uniref:type II toxin-antitoxin system VapC family toxin n=1 Tax=Nostoc sp. LPT TaxID=2815387 RepID=UPI0025F3AD0A|nr:type II toxin-antitoxin system VapC family toxin [Nostoc sp. LPT]